MSVNADKKEKKAYEIKNRIGPITIFTIHFLLYLLDLKMCKSGHLKKHLEIAPPD